MCPGLVVDVLGAPVVVPVHFTLQFVFRMQMICSFSGEGESVVEIATKPPLNFPSSFSRTTGISVFNAINDFLWVLRNVSILGLRPFDWISLFSVPQIPELAQGGVLKRGQVGVLEGNGAEAVVPLEKNREWIHAVAQDFGREMGGATTVTINVYGAQGQDINELAEVISRKINDAVSRDRRVFA